MTDFAFLMQLMDALLLPLIGGGALGVVKLTHGETARRAEQNFYVLLAVVTLVTIRTVIKCDPAWLIHTMTLAVMVVGGLAIPSQNHILGDRERAAASRAKVA